MMTDPVRISDYYHFYEDNNRNGLKYDIAVDNAIIDLLNNENEIISYKLKSRTDHLLMKSNNNINLLGTAMKFERSDVEKAFVLLMQNGLVKIASDFHGNEARY